MHTKLLIFLTKKKRSIMAGCFPVPEFRMRTSSFDLHQLAQHNRLSKLGKLFRSKSDDSMKVGESPKGSPRGSPKGSPKTSPGSQRRRRFMRVVKNKEAEGEEYENPHVIRRYTQEFVESQYETRSYSMDDHDLPYTVSGHTILKKMSSQDSPSPRSHSPPHKHASFNEDVEIIEFEKKQKILEHACEKLHGKLQNDEYIPNACVYFEHEKVCCKVVEKYESEDSASEAEGNASMEETRSDTDSICSTTELAEKFLLEHSATESTSDNVDAKTAEDQVKHTSDCDADTIVDKLIHTHVNMQADERSRSLAFIPAES